MHEGAVRVGKQVVPVQVFEIFIEAIFAGTLEGVSNECRGPTEDDTAQALFGINCTPCGDVGFVDVSIDLATTFYQIERGNGRVSWSYTSSGLCQELWTIR